MSPARLLALALPALLGCGWELREPAFAHGADTVSADASDAAAPDRADAPQPDASDDAPTEIAAETGAETGADATPDVAAVDATDAGRDAAPDTGPMDTGPPPDAGPCERACGAGDTCRGLANSSTGNPGAVAWWGCCAPSATGACGALPRVPRESAEARDALCCDPFLPPTHVCGAGFDLRMPVGARERCCRRYGLGCLAGETHIATLGNLCCEPD